MYEFQNRKNSWIKFSNLPNEIDKKNLSHEGQFALQRTAHLQRAAANRTHSTISWATKIHKQSIFGYHNNACIPQLCCIPQQCTHTTTMYAYHNHACIPHLCMYTTTMSHTTTMHACHDYVGIPQPCMHTTTMHA